MLLIINVFIFLCGMGKQYSLFFINIASFIKFCNQNLAEVISEGKLEEADGVGFQITLTRFPE